MEAEKLLVDCCCGAAFGVALGGNEESEWWWWCCCWVGGAAAANAALWLTGSPIFPDNTAGGIDGLNMPGPDG